MAVYDSELNCCKLHEVKHSSQMVPAQFRHCELWDCEIPYKHKGAASMCRKVLCYGDSNTYGYDPRSYFGGRYPETVRWTALLEKQGWTIYNEGENGCSIPQGEWEAERVSQLITRLEPDVVTVMLGSNDLLQDSRLSAEGCAIRMEQFMRRLLNQSCTSRFLLVSPPPMTIGAWTNDTEVIKTSQELSAYYKIVAQRLDIDFVDTMDWDVALTFDGVHFSEEGHLVLLKISTRY